MVIGLPPVLNFGPPELKKRIIPDVFAGKKFISLAISEAFAGSDVAGLKLVLPLDHSSNMYLMLLRRCTATKSEDGSYWTINGTKK